MIEEEKINSTINSSKNEKDTEADTPALDTVSTELKSNPIASSTTLSRMQTILKILK